MFCWDCASGRCMVPPWGARIGEHAKCLLSGHLQAQIGSKRAGMLVGVAWGASRIQPGAGGPRPWTSGELQEFLRGIDRFLGSLFCRAFAALPVSSSGIGCIFRKSELVSDGIPPNRGCGIFLGAHKRAERGQVPAPLRVSARKLQSHFTQNGGPLRNLMKRGDFWPGLCPITRGFWFFPVTPPDGVMRRRSQERARGRVCGFQTFKLVSTIFPARCCLATARGF